MAVIYKFGGVRRSLLGLVCIFGPQRQACAVCSGDLLRRVCADPCLIFGLPGSRLLVRKVVVVLLQVVSKGNTSRNALKG
jgi:hypothetical protein